MAVATERRILVPLARGVDDWEKKLVKPEIQAHVPRLRMLQSPDPESLSVIAGAIRDSRTVVGREQFEDEALREILKGGDQNGGSNQLVTVVDGDVLQGFALFGVRSIPHPDQNVRASLSSAKPSRPVGASGETLIRLQQDAVLMAHWVAPEFRGRGLAKLLVVATASVSRASGASRLCALVDFSGKSSSGMGFDTRTSQFFMGLKFKEIGVHSHGQTAVVVALDLPRRDPDVDTSFGGKVGGY